MLLSVYTFIPRWHFSDVLVREQQSVAVSISCPQCRSYISHNKSLCDIGFVMFVMLAQVIQI